MTSASTEWILTLKDQITRPLNNVRKSTDKALEGVRKIGAMNFYAVGQSVRELNNQVKALNEPFIEYEASLKELKAITNATDEQVKKMGEAAREAAKQFGTNAAQNVESYKLLLSQLSPEIANNTDALAAMGNNVNILSKQLKGDTTAATEVLTTAMNQYGVSLKDPMQASKKMAEMMNVMSAAAQAGSAELPRIKMALQQAGLTAKTQKVSFEELNAAIQVLDKAGKKGAEGGVALRNVMSSLSMGRFLPKEATKELEGAGIDVNKLADKSLSLQERLRMLNPIVEDSALLSKIFGKENQAAAIALIQNSDTIGTLRQKISGTNSATDQANIIMGSWKEQLKRVKANIQDVALAIGQYTTPFQPAIEVTSQLAMTASSMGSIYSGLAPVFKTVGSAAKALAGRIKTLALSFLSTPFGQITALIAGVGFAIYKATNYIKKQREAVLHNSKAWIEQQAALRVHKDLEHAVIESTAGRIAKLKYLTRIAGDETLSLKTRMDAMRELVDIDESYAKVLDQNGINTDKLTQNTARLTEEIKKNARIVGVRHLIEKKSEELAENELKLEPIQKEIDKHKNKISEYKNILKKYKHPFWHTGYDKPTILHYINREEKKIKKLQNSEFFQQNKQLKADINKATDWFVDLSKEQNNQKTPTTKKPSLNIPIPDWIRRVTAHGSWTEPESLSRLKNYQFINPALSKYFKYEEKNRTKTKPPEQKDNRLTSVSRRSDESNHKAPVTQQIEIHNVFHVSSPADIDGSQVEKIAEAFNRQLSDGTLKKSWG